MFRGSLSQLRLSALERALWVAAAALLVASGAAVAAHHGPARAAAAVRTQPGVRASGEESALALSSLRTTTTTAPPSTTTTVPPPPTTAPPPKAAPAAAPKASAAGSLSYERLNPPAVPAGLKPYVGLGTWSDVFDWSNTYTNNHPGTSAADVDQMKPKGVQTLYIQASHDDSPGDLTDPDLLVPIIHRAKQDGLNVVGWYLPTLTDPQKDLERLEAIAKLPDVDSVAVDIEARNVSDVN